MSEFLPINREEMEARGWQQPDFVYICGDAYVDHPSFGAAIICRTLESHGFKVCFLAQPDWHNVEEFRQFGKPRLGFLISSGNIDSMVNHYTVAKKRRHKDLYTPGSEGFKRPDRAVIVYSQMARQAYKDANIIIGGIEASLRRLGHYDYWDNKVRKSIIIDANADLLLYGMGENSIIEVAEALDNGLEIKYLTYLDGTVFKTKNLDDAHEPVMLPSYEEICNNKKAYAKSFHIQYLNTDHFNAKTLVEPYQGWYVVQNRPNRPLKQREFDRAYSYDYNRDSHPSYKQHVPAIDEVKFSLIEDALVLVTFVHWLFIREELFKRVRMNQLLVKLAKWFGILNLKDIFMMLEDLLQTLEGLLVLSKINMVHVRLNSVYGLKLVII